MNYDNVMSLILRALVLGASVLIALGIIEYAAGLLGHSVINEAHTPGRLIEIGAALTVIVIAMLLRQIRDQLRKNNS